MTARAIRSLQIARPVRQKPLPDPPAIRVAVVRDRSDQSRATGGFCLRPLTGNTGTQIDLEMVPAQQDYPLVNGTRLILGGTVRFKFEVT